MGDIYFTLTLSGRLEGNDLERALKHLNKVHTGKVSVEFGDEVPRPLLDAHMSVRRTKQVKVYFQLKEDGTMVPVRIVNIGD